MTDFSSSSGVVSTTSYHEASSTGDHKFRSAPACLVPPATVAAVAAAAAAALDGGFGGGPKPKNASEGGRFVETRSIQREQEDAGPGKASHSARSQRDTQVRMIRLWVYQNSAPWMLRSLLMATIMPLDWPPPPPRGCFSVSLFLCPLPQLFLSVVLLLLFTWWSVSILLVVVLALLGSSPMLTRERKKTKTGCRISGLLFVIVTGRTACRLLNVHEVLRYHTHCPRITILLFELPGVSNKLFTY